MKGVKKLWLGLIILMMLSPLGLHLPAKLGAGSAWGEWSGQELKKLVGFVPSGLSKLERLWKAPMPDYAIRGPANPSCTALSLSYILSAVIGVAVVAGVAIFLGRLLTKKGNSTDAS